MCKIIRRHPASTEPGSSPLRNPSADATELTDGERERCCEGVQSCLDPAFFKALCDPTRLFILLELARRPGPSTVSEIGCCSEVDLSVVSRHLKMLRDAGIAESEKKGKEVRYTIRYGNVVQTLRALADAIERCCPDDRPTCCASPIAPTTASTPDHSDQTPHAKHDSTAT